MNPAEISSIELMTFSRIPLVRDALIRVATCADDDEDQREKACGCKKQASEKERPDQQLHEQVFRLFKLVKREFELMNKEVCALPNHQSSFVAINHAFVKRCDDVLHRSPLRLQLISETLI